MAQSVYHIRLFFVTTPLSGEKILEEWIKLKKNNAIDWK